MVKTLLSSRNHNSSLLPMRMQFTGYERDNESSLDFAQARYYGYNHGRFTSPDPLLASATSNNPQSWNEYIYAGNIRFYILTPTAKSGEFVTIRATASRFQMRRQKGLSSTVRGITPRSFERTARYSTRKATLRGHTPG